MARSFGRARITSDRKTARSCRWRRAADVDDSSLGVHALVVVTTLTLVLLTVGLHYEGLSALARGLSHRRGPRRPRVLYAVLGALGLHIAQIWLFGIGLWALLLLSDAGSIQGSRPGLLDAVYLSAITYTTVGFGDLVPVGAIRFLSGTEALCGLLMITWSASFSYFEMERNWRER